MIEDRFLKRMRKKAKKGFRGWPVVTVAFYGPDRSHATKVAVGIIRAEGAEAEEMRDWRSDRGDIRSDPAVAREILEFIDKSGVASVAMAGAVIGCPHQQDIDYDGDWCPAPECQFWRGRNRFTGEPET